MKTLSLIKPHAFKHFQLINQMLIDNQFEIVASKIEHITEEKARLLYDIHSDRLFFSELIETITESPCFINMLEGEDVIARHRALMGATDPQKAEKNTIRFLYGESIGKNAIHGSDSEERAKIELALFF